MPGLAIAVPAPLRQLVSTRFGVIATGAGGEPVNDARIRIALVMPAMVMPPSVVECVRTSPAARPGYYVGVGTFTMTGSWRLDATAALPSGKRLSASRMVEVR